MRRTPKMKFSFVFLLLLDFPHLNRQQRIQEFQHIRLSLVFPPVYNNHNKACCKLSPSNCYKLMDSTGYTYEWLRGRVTKTENDGWIEFKISNVRFVDAGYYRCSVLDTHIYTDYYVEVTEAPVHRTSAQPLLTATTTPLSTSKSLRPDSTGPVLSQDHSDSDGDSLPWSFVGLPLLIVVSCAAMIVISLVVGVVCYRVKAKREQPDKCGETLCESQKQDALEANSVVYSTVDFRGHQESTDVYANVRISKTRAGPPDPAGQTVYATLAIHQ